MRFPILLIGLFAAGCEDTTRTATPMGDLSLADFSMAMMMGADLAGRDLSATPGMDMAKPAGGDLATTSYPAGPYGNKVGNTIPPLVWEGYPDPLADAIASSKTYGPYSMNDLRLTGKPWGVVHVAEFT